MLAASNTVTDHLPSTAPASTVFVKPDVLVNVTLEPASAVPEIFRSVLSDALTRSLPATASMTGAPGPIASPTMNVREAARPTLPAASRATTVTVSEPWPKVLTASNTMTDHLPSADALAVCV